MLSSEEKFNIIKQSISGQIEGPAFEAIQAAEQQIQQQEQEAPQSEQQSQIPQTPVGPPPAQTIPTVYDQQGALIAPGETGVGLNQMAGTSPGQTIQPGEYKTGGKKSKKKSTTSEDDTSIRDYGMLPEITLTDTDPVRPWMLLKKLRRNWAKNLNPFGYGPNPLKTAFETGVLNKKDIRESAKMDVNKLANKEKLEDSKVDQQVGDRENASMWAKERVDLLHTLMGHSQKHNSLIQNDDSSFRSPYTEKEIKRRMNKLFDKTKTDYTAEEKERIISNSMKHGNYGGRVLGNHPMTHGTDEKGNYVDYSDVWDLNPLDKRSKVPFKKSKSGFFNKLFQGQAADDAVTGFSKHILGMTPPEIKGRVYYETGGPKSNAAKPLTEEDAKLEEEWPLMLQKQRFVESGFNTNAKSKAGAIGSAQIMPDTLQYAKDKGWVDNDVKMKDLTGADGFSISQHIQEKYMENLFNREWNKGPDEVKTAKALLAYNWGPNRTRKKLNKLKDRGIDIYSNTEFSKYFNKESREYKGKILDDLTTKKDPYVQRDYNKLKDLSPLLRMHGGPKVLYNNKKSKK